MAEIEIHHAHGHDSDPLAAKVGVAVGIIGIVLAVVTIASHREHTAAVIHKTEANDQWAFYQAKKTRAATLEVGLDLLEVLGGDPAKAQAASAKMTADRERYVKESAEIMADAQAKDEAGEHAEHRAFRFDLGEGLLELGLVLCSLYFLSKNRIFPIFGIIAALTGAALGLSGWLL
jgi:hypothetical protein